VVIKRSKAKHAYAALTAHQSKTT